MTQALRQDSTLKDLRLSSKEAAAFVRKVIAVMRVVRRDDGDLLLRMGVTGTGVAPNYRLEKQDGEPIVAIDGANHQPWPAGTRFDGLENWSTATMSYADVEDVISSLTGYQRGRASRA